MTSSTTKWQIWIDTGGTFTDCIARDPGGVFHKTKVLSSSALRGTILEWINSQKIRIRQNWNAPNNFVKGFQFHLLGREHAPVPVHSFDARNSIINLQEELPVNNPPNSFEVTSDIEAPILAARLVTKTTAGQQLPPSDLRLATTKGTNALLEHKGVPTLFLVTEGFGDLLRIGDQKRPDLFALNIEKPKPLYREVIEVPERIDSEGNPIRSLQKNSLKAQLEQVQSPAETSVALCLMNSYKNATHEQEVANLLEELGFNYISVSSELSPFIKILPRAQTTVVNAYLAPILHEYIDRVREELSSGSFRMMTSAGGLVDTENFNPKDSLLSGPAGGVVGASAVGKKVGFKHIISFDMGGTSTDVARYDNEFDYLFQHQVGDARLAAPALSIETVAAGGGSICSFDGFKLTVGPESAGADPGPACYGAGGPLTVTDVNLLLGRLEPENFGIPVSMEASQQRLDEIIKQVNNQKAGHSTATEILEGFLQIANERMADAIRKISLRKGYDPREYAIVAFGGAGAQHTCAIASQLDISDIVIPTDAGLLSAYGLGNAVIERFEEQQILQKLQDVGTSLEKQFEELGEKAIAKLQQEGIPEAETELRRRSVFMRLEGQEATLEVNFGDGKELAESFKQLYLQRYGHWIGGRTIEVESIRVVASSKKPKFDHVKETEPESTAQPRRTKEIIFNGEKVKTPILKRSHLSRGQKFSGPALILDPYSTIVVDPGWALEVRENGSLVLFQVDAHSETASSRISGGRSEAVALELFTNRFTSVAEEMGEMLRRTALSVNVKERMDFSCALLNADGELIVNAPHIPVHLGALGICVRRLQETIEMNPGDVIVTNHPAFGGSHLPDITIVTPIFTKDPSPELIGFAASRAHHAEIGGTRPGSMPPDASTLAEEGVVIPPMHLIKEGNEQWDQMRRQLESAEYPTRDIEENIADLQAAVAANNRGAHSLLQLVEAHAKESVLHYMSALKQYAADKMRATIRNLPKGSFETTELLDDGTRLKANITITERAIIFDFEDTALVHPGNLNATPAIVNSVIIYILRLLVDEELPLNEGLLEPVSIQLPKNSILNPDFPQNPRECPAVVGGNVETSQRLVDLLLKPFEKIACSQGTMNNVLFGNDSFGYYETIGGGTGAGPDFHGTDAVHHHMTNTAGTDPEILEQRYPVRLDCYSIRKNSGGSGDHHGGNGIQREMTFLEPVSLSVLTQHRREQPYGLNGGNPGQRGKQWVIRNDGTRETLASIDGADLQAGDRFYLLTPGGGGFGS
ncbi:hydantoinase B/oxoprolinase family protein [Aliifodinibius sp. S!AR15-10]|uniref:hydantoinase B/oxoprolinase family protein n=1 Tax=Aliifodinibius sp. S!AR15-10 TaxID=2950437 RepID=UPI00285ED9CA|nr:hydantoinase B/oxoprolinase family protein [Aliifodinibius sp. S!AR15-10]MDR8392199.1 hydantoinase B/oxoprolinase family protein [Aliifodinibius sp. S!AR15-10]